MKTCAWIFPVIAVCSAGCATPATKPIDSGTPPVRGTPDAGRADVPTGSIGGFVTFVAGGSVMRIEARPGAAPLNISEALNALAQGKEETPAVSRNGSFITITTNRFDPDCVGYSCLAVVKGDLSAAEMVRIGGQPLRPRGHAAISNDGTLIVYPSDDGPHARDLYATRRVDGIWRDPVLLTASSTHQYNEQVVLSPDGESALFNCGPVPYGSNGTGVCEVGTDGTMFQRKVDPNANPLGESGEYVSKNADYTSDGSIVFEADWSGEQLWRLASDDLPSLVIESHSNDNSPCSLPGGYIASLWLGRPDGGGIHELTITAPDGSESFVVLPGVDVLDIDVMCHE